MKPIVVLGAGGYAQEIAWIIDDINAVAPEWHLVGFVDPTDAGKTEHYGRPVLGSFDAVAPCHDRLYFACGIGAPAIRLKESLAAERLGWCPAALIHPSVIRAKQVVVGPGSVIGAGSTLGPAASIGRHCAINVQVTIGHDSWIGDYSVVSPGARILGHSVIEEQAFVGSNATVYPRRRLGAGALLGANSFLQTDLAAGENVLGVPARPFTPSRFESTPPRTESAAGAPAPAQCLSIGSLEEAFCTALGMRPPADWTPIRYGEATGWDSIAHMHLISEIEGRFDVLLGTEEVIGLSSFEQACTILSAHGICFEPRSQGLMMRS